MPVWFLAEEAATERRSRREKSCVSLAVTSGVVAKYGMERSLKEGFSGWHPERKSKSGSTSHAERLFEDKLLTQTAETTVCLSLGKLESFLLNQVHLSHLPKHFFESLNRHRLSRVRMDANAFLLAHLRLSTLTKHFLHTTPRLEFVVCSQRFQKNVSFSFFFTKSFDQAAASLLTAADL